MRNDEPVIYLGIIKYILLGSVFIAIFNIYRDNKQAMAALCILNLLLLINELIRLKIGRTSSFLGLASITVSIAGAAVLKYYLTGVGANVYIFSPLFEIFRLRGKRMKLLLSLNALTFASVILLKGGISNIESRLPDIGLNLLSYLGMACIFYLRQNLRNEKEEIKELNEELKASNQKLREYSLQVEELTVAKERTRVAQELHDSLGHSLMALTMHLEFAEKVFDTKPEKVKVVLAKTKDIAKDSIGNLRKVVSALKEEREIRDLTDAVSELVENFSILGNIKINFNMDRELENLGPDIKNSIYKTVREGLTNGIKHGRATLFDIELRLEHGGARLEIRDNGAGCGNIEESTGLKGIRERIAALGGTVTFSSRSGGGFRIVTEFPIYEEGSMR